MTIEELRTLIAPDEHRQLELKKSTGELNVGMHSAVVTVTFPRRDVQKKDASSVVGMNEVGDKKSTQESTRKILCLMALNPHITISELCEATGLSEKGVKINIGKLKSSGKLRRVGSNKGGHWEVLE